MTEITYHWRPTRAPVLWIACIGKERRTTPSHQVTTDPHKVTCEHCKACIDRERARSLPNRGLCDCPPDTRGDACNGTCKAR